MHVVSAFPEQRDIFNNRVLPVAGISNKLGTICGCSTADLAMTAGLSTHLSVRICVCVRARLIRLCNSHVVTVRKFAVYREARRVNKMIS